MTVPIDKCAFCTAVLPAEYYKIYEHIFTFDKEINRNYFRVCPMCHDVPSVQAKLENRCPYTSPHNTFKPIRRVNGNTIGILKKISQLLVSVSHLEKRVQNLENK